MVGEGGSTIMVGEGVTSGMTYAVSTRRTGSLPLDSTTQ